MGKQLIKRRRRDDGSAIAMDRLSQLPQPILHQILSLLSQKDAVRTGVLSKSWRYLWHGRLNLELVNRWFAGKEEIRSFLDKTLQRYHDQNLSLESVRIGNCRNFFLHLNNMHFLHLKSLNLRKVQLPAEIFDNSSSFFPCLNELILDSCYGLGEFLLSSCSIKRLTIKMDWRNRIKALIDTPNILYFEYSSSGFLPSIKFAATSNQWKSYISVGYVLKPSDNDATSWFLKLSKLLTAFSQSRIILNLILKKYDNLHINEPYGGYCEPVVVKRLRLSGYFKSSSVPGILNCFFRICRPRYICMDLYNGQVKWKKENNRLAESICKLIPKEIGCYSWLQDLEEVTTKVWDMKAKEWTSLPALPSKQLILPVRFRLTWREQLSKFT